MSYFTVNRIITFFAGISLLYGANKIFESAQDYVYVNILYGFSILLLLLGMYVVVASLIPYRKTTNTVSEIVLEGLAHIIIELIFKGLIRMFVGLISFFTH